MSSKAKNFYRRPSLLLVLILLLLLLVYILSESPTPTPEPVTEGAMIRVNNRQYFGGNKVVLYNRSISSQVLASDYFSQFFSVTPENPNNAYRVSILYDNDALRCAIEIPAQSNVTEIQVDTFGTSFDYAPTGGCNILVRRGGTITSVTRQTGQELRL
jgi:hypothetical protein